ncbi:SusC/RagA family TonB-linked outer membrane protein [Phaeodactylibacter luteus]|uniref:SusC/RagA family TonB-linked outer membrane protein n=1 Tax=Phaeodactylibacter luteus TaxID=1564516 RepID=A0A5C6RU86_9BACT|nr:SusC/RagA family TonB-linked outer membrane protein [Phaeodactylibacter luteus]TXB65579.1 SusC/RagA family TonB-linked outer membrane protein [Phaeodactylibacter luteus]
MAKDYVLAILCTVMGMLPVHAQHTVSGTVTDGQPSPQPLIGVSVFVKDDPSAGTVTDIDGGYTLEAGSKEAVLIFTYIGYRRLEVPVGGRERIDVRLSEAAALLDEVVVTAVGIERSQKALGYAAQEVGGEQLSNAREGNLVNALSAKVAGVQVVSSSGNPGASANIVIRGRTSLGENSPLFIIDGVPIDNSFAGSNFTDQSNRAIDINPDDIESLNILKGGAATALYGVRAANGAVVITTKKGRKKGGLSFAQSITFDQVNKLPEQQQLFAQGDLSGGVPVYAAPGESNRSWGPRMDTLRYDGDPTYRYSRLGRIVGQSDPTATAAAVAPFDNLGNFFNTGVTSSTYLSASGGGESASYFASGGYLRQTGIVPNSTFERITLKVSGDAQLSPKLKVQASANYINSGGDRTNRGSNLSGVMLGLARAPASFDLANGYEDAEDETGAYLLPDGTPRTYWGAYDNPYWSVNRNLSRDRVNRIIGNAGFSYELAPWLNAVYRLGTDFYFEERTSHWDNQSNEFGTGVIFNDLYAYRSVNSDFLLTAESRLSESFTARLTAGHNYFSERGYSSVQEGENFIIPGFYDISNVSQVTFVDDSETRRRIAGAFYDGQVGFRDYLYLSFTGRWDWSSTLPTENVPFFYDSYSLGFVFTEPLGLATDPVFSFGKLRLSYARIGKDAFAYALDNFFVLGSPVKGQTAFSPSTSIGNPGLRPEQTRTMEIGADLRFFQSRLGLDVTWYDLESTDQILAVPVTFSTGFSTVITNAGRVRNRGVELQLNATPLQTESFSWDVDLNFTANENTVESLGEGVPDLSFGSAGVASTNNRAIEGQPFGVLYGTRWSRSEAGDLLIDADGYPVYDPQDPGIVGDPNPDWLAGLRNSFSWKGLYASVLLDIRQGGDIFNGTVGVMKNLGTHKSTEQREEEVVIEGVYAPGTVIDGEEVGGQPNRTAVRRDSRYYSRYPFAGVSEAAIEDGSWVRLRELTISYRFPEAVTARLPVRSLELGLSGRNLFLFTPYSGIDPETNLAGASNSFGRDYFNSPNTRSLGVNLKIGL